MRGSAGLWNKIQRVLLPNKVQRNQLKSGDHIWTWRQKNVKHHGIYVGDGMVIHFEYANPRVEHGVLSSTVDQFRSGGKLYVFEYDVNPTLFLAIPGGNNCTTASANPTEDVLHRACFLLENSSADYRPYIKNSYDFATYCKTGLITFIRKNVIRYERVAFDNLSLTIANYFSILKMMPASYTDLAATALGIYITCRLALDIGVHPRFIKVEVESFAQVEALAPSSLFIPRTVRSFFILYLVPLICGSISLTLSMWSMARPLVWGLAGIKFLYWPLLHRTFEFRRVFSNKLRRNQLQPGDHIYTWRNWYSYAHHGIYVGRGMVIHLTRGGGPILSSLFAWYNQPMPDDPDRVEMCSIDTFLSGGNIYLHEYGVDLAFFIAKIRGGTCTLAHSDPPRLVLYRANFLLEENFRAYNLFYSNCEDFSLYCKTGLLVPRFIALGSSGQIISLFAAICGLIFFPYSSLLTSIGDFGGRLVVGYVLYSFGRLFSDTRFRRDAHSVGVRELDGFDRSIATHLLTTIRPKFGLIGRFWFCQRTLAIPFKNCLVDWILMEFAIFLFFT